MGKAHLGGPRRIHQSARWELVFRPKSHGLRWGTVGAGPWAPAGLKGGDMKVFLPWIAGGVGVAIAACAPHSDSLGVPGAAGAGGSYSDGFGGNTPSSSTGTHHPSSSSSHSSSNSGSSSSTGIGSAGSCDAIG